MSSRVLAAPTCLDGGFVLPHPLTRRRPPRSHRVLRSSVPCIPRSMSRLRFVGHPMFREAGKRRISESGGNRLIRQRPPSGHTCWWLRPAGGLEQWGEAVVPVHAGPGPPAGTAAADIGAGQGTRGAPCTGCAAGTGGRKVATAWEVPRHSVQGHQAGPLELKQSRATRGPKVLPGASRWDGWQEPWAVTQTSWGTHYTVSGEVTGS